MQDVFVGLIALAIGATFCFRGAVAMRLMIMLWGSFTGFLLGAGVIAGVDDVGFLRTMLGWIVGVIVGGVFGIMAYLFYEVSVMLAMGSIGFAIGTSVMVALGVSWTWVVIFIGLAFGVTLAVVSMAGNLPSVILLVLSAFGGSSVIVAGAMLLTGAVNSSEFTHASVTQRLNDDWWWYALYLGLAVAGLLVQLKDAERVMASMRESWESSPSK